MIAQLAASGQSEAEHSRLTAALFEAGSALQQGAREQAQQVEAFSYAVAHDLRTPIRNINYWLSRLRSLPGAARDAEVAAEVAGVLEQIGHSTAQMSALIAGLLELAIATHQPPGDGRVDMSALPRAVGDALARSEPARSVELAIQPDMVAYGDPSLLRSVLENLIGNAWKSTARCERARIQVTRSGGESGLGLFCVGDSGVGFDPAAAARLFTPLHRLHPQHEFPGTGIGLTVAERIVRRHGGQIWAEGNPGRGASFYFTLPDRAAQPAPGHKQSPSVGRA